MAPTITSADGAPDSDGGHRCIDVPVAPTGFVCVAATARKRAGAAVPEIAIVGV